MRSLAVLSVLVLVVITPVSHAADDFEKVKNSYFGVLAFPCGVRSIGLGMTGVADDTDPANVYYNPAVAAFGLGIALTGGVSNWLYGMDISDVGVSATAASLFDGRSNLHLGAGIRYARLDAEPRPSAQPTSFEFTGPIDVDFTDWYLASTVAAGYTAGPVDIAAGFAVKYLEVRVADGKADEWTYDTGLLAKYEYRRPDGVSFIPSFGVSALSWGGRQDEVIDPVAQVRYGIGLRLEAVGLQESGRPLSRETPILAITIDGELLDFVDSNRELGSGVGVELSLVNILSIRYGYADKQFAFDYAQTFGGGLGYGWRRAYFRLDFAMAFESNQSRHVNAVGFLVDVDI